MKIVLSQVGVTTQMGFGLMTRFTDHFNTQLVTMLNHSAIAISTLYKSLEHKG